MNERIFRWGMAGWMFFISTAFSYWFFGGDFRPVVDYFNSDIKGDLHSALISLSIALLTSPVIGFIISMLIRVPLLLWRWKFNSPEYRAATKEYEYIYQEKIDGSFSRSDEGETKKRKEQLTYIKHQVLFRELVESKKEALAFASRRTDSFSVHLNLIGSIIFGFVLGLWIGFYFCFDRADLECAWKKVFWILPLLFILFSCYLHARFAWRELNDFEKLFIIRNLKEP